MRVGHQQITCCWDKMWIPVNQFLNHEIVSSEGTDLTTYFEGKEKLYLLSVCRVPNTVLCVLLCNLIGFSKQPWRVAVDIHPSKMREQRLKEIKSCPKVAWPVRTEMEIPMKYMYFSSPCFFSLHTAIPVNKTQGWVTHTRSDSPV